MVVDTCDVSYTDPAITIPNAWPDGAYSLPMPKLGCPANGGDFKWHEGSRYQDTEDDDSANSFSNPLSLAGDFWRNNMKTHFCTKTDSRSDHGIAWPKGSYCIARKGGNCPSGFSEGHIFWDDEDSDNRNSDSGILPDGSYDSNTRIYFCCRSDGFATNEIILPTDEPFVLYRYGPDGCQRVADMSYRQDYVHWDCEDSSNNNSNGGVIPYGEYGRNIKIYYCYYD